MSLVVSNLKKEYTGVIRKKRKNLAVNNVSFEIKEGQVYALVGQNGAGKTTTIKCILKLIKQTGGKITFNNKDIYNIMSNTGVGYMPELLTFPESISLQKYLIEIGILRGKKRPEILKKIDYLAELLNMKEKITFPITGYSKGMKKKANFMQAVMHEPVFLVLDEPTDGLDPVSRRIVLDYIRKMAENGCTILITSHILADLERVAHVAGIIHSGLLLDEISTEQFKKADMDYVKWDMEEWYFNTLIKAGDINVANYKV